MTTDSELLQQALAALLGSLVDDGERDNAPQMNAIAAIRARLAEPDDTEALAAWTTKECQNCGGTVWRLGTLPSMQPDDTEARVRRVTDAAKHYGSTLWMLGGLPNSQADVDAAEANLERIVREELR